MIQHKIGDLFSSNADVIAHQVNCRGAMGSGVAKQIRIEFPGAYVHYKCACKTAGKDPARLLGYTQITLVRLSNDYTVRVANLFAQDNFGYDGRQYTDYEAFRTCLFKLRLYVDTVAELQGKRLSIAMPYRIGCDRGGGDWDTIYKIIEEEIGDLDVTLYELPKM